MATINISEKTLKRFNVKRVKYSAYEGKNVSQEDFTNILLDKFEKENENQN